MRPILEKVTTNANQSFALKEDIRPHIEIGWHFHPEYELTLIAESYGQRVVGDHIANFEAGDVLLIGPNLPHYMRNDPGFYQNRSEFRCRAIVAHFEPTFLGEHFFRLPETQSLSRLLGAASRGIHVYGETALRLAKEMELLLQKEGMERLLCLLSILSSIAKTSEWVQLASPGYVKEMKSSTASKIGQVFQYMFEHFRDDISLRQVAASVSLSDANFCKLMKRHTGKTFSQTLNEMRIGHACRLLIEGEASMSEIAFSCGYSSPSYFNRKFRQMTQSTPKTYRAQFQFGARYKK